MTDEKKIRKTNLSNAILVVFMALSSLSTTVYAINVKDAHIGHVEHVKDKYQPEAMCYGQVRQFDNTYIQDFLVTGEDVKRISVYSFEDKAGVSISESRLPGVMSLRQNSDTVTCDYYGYSQ